MTILPAHTASRIRNRSMGVLHLIAADERCEVSDILALITPSQPYPPPSAAQTDGEVTESSSHPADPSVDPIAPLHFSDHPAGAENEVEPTPSPLPGDPADGADIPPNRVSAPSAAFSPAPAKGDQVRACHAEHPDWPANVIAAHLGMKPTSVRAFASLLRLSLPSQRDYVAAQAAKTAEALRVAIQPETPPTATHEPASEVPEPPEQQPAAEPPRPAVQSDATDVLHRVKQAPTGRFYLRERTSVGTEGRYLHQSLAPCPSGPGPLMTTDRAWAWFDNSQRYRGALKKWPELATMRKVGPAK